MSISRLNCQSVKRKAGRDESYWLDIISNRLCSMKGIALDNCEVGTAIVIHNKPMTPIGWPNIALPMTTRAS